MRQTKLKPAGTRRVSPRISKGHEPIVHVVPPPPGGPRPDPTPEQEEKLIQRGTLMAVVYAEVGSYSKVAELFDVAEATVRWWCHETRKRARKDLESIAQRLRGDLASIAVDRVQEGLLEGSTEFAATLGAKLLHGLGELKSHSAVKNDVPPGTQTLTLNIVRADPAAAAPEIAAGAVLGSPYLLAAEGEVLPDAVEAE